MSTVFIAKRFSNLKKHQLNLISPNFNHRRSVVRLSSWTNRMSQLQNQSNLFSQNFLLVVPLLLSTKKSNLAIMLFVSFAKICVPNELTKQNNGIAVRPASYLPKFRCLQNYANLLNSWLTNSTKQQVKLN